MPKKDSQTNRAVVPSVVLQEKRKTETVSHALRVKCILLYALIAVKKPRFLSNLQATSPFTAVNAISPVEATGKSSISIPSLAFGWGGF